MENYFKGSKAALQEFAKTKNAFPIWKISNIGKASIMDSNLNVIDPNKSLQLLEEALKHLPQGSIYLLSVFKPERRTYGASNSSFMFSAGEEEKKVNGMDTQHLETINHHNTPMQQQPTAPAYENRIDPPAYSERIGLSDHIQLINKAASAEAKLMYMENIVKDQAAEIAALRTEVTNLETEITALELELDEFDNAEEEAEEGDEIGAAEAPPTLESALAGLIKENGAVIIENLISKGVKGAPEFTEPEPVDNATVNGITPELYTAYSVEALNNEMLLIDPHWKKHLFKLVMIGQQKPATFKMLISKLEAF